LDICGKNIETPSMKKPLPANVSTMRLNPEIFSFSAVTIESSWSMFSKHGWQEVKSDSSKMEK
jgi:hypothetical protein